MSKRDWQNPPQQRFRCPCEGRGGDNNYERPPIIKKAEEKGRSGLWMDRLCFWLKNEEEDEWEPRQQHSEDCAKRRRSSKIKGASERRTSMGEQSHQVYRFYEAQAEVGKGGIWDPDNGLYYYIDIAGKTLHVLRIPDFYREDYDVGTQVGAMALIEGGWGLVMAVQDGFGIWDFDKKKLEMVATPYGIDSGWRMNDGACDSRGRFWAGRLFMADETQPGEIYRLERDGTTVTSVIQGICCTNGVLWSPDDTLMYCGDSSMKKIFVWDYDEESGTVRNKRLFVDTRPVFDGVPDGATIDCEGFLWVCFYDGHKMVRISPSGKVDRVYDLPVKRPTQPIWFGEYLDELLITSAGKGVNLDDCPESGNILRLKAGVQGQLKAKFRYSGNRYSLYNRRRGSSRSPSRRGSPQRSPSKR